MIHLESCASNKILEHETKLMYSAAKWVYMNMHWLQLKTTSSPTKNTSTITLLHQSMLFSCLCFFPSTSQFPWLLFTYSPGLSMSPCPPVFTGPSLHFPLYDEKAVELKWPEGPCRKRHEIGPFGRLKLQKFILLGAWELLLMVQKSGYITS